LDYDRFLSDTASEFTQEQTAILREGSTPEKWITTNLFPVPFSPALDMEDITKGMDFASWDNYPVWGDQDEPYPYFFKPFLMSYVRGLNPDKPFTVMEQMTGIQGHVCLGHLPPEQRVALWTSQAIARGANRIVYFRWRTAPFAQEQLCYGLLDTDNRDTERMRVLGENIVEAKEALSPIASTRFESPACLLYSKDDIRLLREQYLSTGLVYQASELTQVGADAELAKWFAPFAIFNVNADVESVRSVDLDRYKLISLPLYQMADPEFVERLAVWVERGGVLVLGYRAGARDLENKNVTSPLPGVFRALAGVRVSRFESLNRTRARIRIGSLPIFAHGEIWADLVEPETARPVAWWSDRKKFYRGSPCITVNTLGKGKVWYLGTSPDALAIFLLYRRILKSAGLRPRFAGYGVEIVDRRKEDGTEVSIILNHTGRRRRVLGRSIEPWGWKTAPKKK
jgi:beta-galactosidase